MANDRHPDETISGWLEAQAPGQLPDRVLRATFERTRRTRQHGRWRAALGRIGMNRATFALAGAALVVVVLLGGAQLTALRLDRPGIGAGPVPSGSLPSTAADWERIVIDPQGEGSVDMLAATPRGLLAAVGEGDEARWYFSADGRSWAAVPPGQITPLGNPDYSVNSVAVAGDDRRILIVGREVLASEDGMTWRRIAGPSDDPDLGAGAIIAVTRGGPGFVGVGARNKAWYSADGTDWTAVEGPPPPPEPSPLAAPLDPSADQGSVEMEGVTSSGGTLLAWGKSIWVHTDGSATFVPVFWRSTDGRSWTAVPAPGGSGWNYPKVAGGPAGFVVTGEDRTAWRSVDGRAWNLVAPDAFGESRWASPSGAGAENEQGLDVQMVVGGLAGGPAGYVAVGTDGLCLLPCGSEEVVIWTSRDGATWTRLQGEGPFAGTPGSDAGPSARHVVGAGDHFVVGGAHDGRPTVWISRSTP